MIVISSVAIASVTLVNGISETPEDTTQFGYTTRPCNVRSVLTETGMWVSFDSSTPGTLAEAHVTVSDTSGITIVYDIHGFWKRNCTVNSTIYDHLEIPGATWLRDEGKPMLPCLFEYVEIPHDTDVTIDILASSSNVTSGYNVRPAPHLTIPSGRGIQYPNSTSFENQNITLDSVYDDNVTYPGFYTSTEGATNTSTLVMRGRRILGLTLYPLQYNPVTQELEVFSQFVIKVKYNILAQICLPVIPLRSEDFEIIFDNILLNYQLANVLYYPQVGYAVEYPVTPLEEPEGAEYLIITNDAFKNEAQRLANWKVKKGVPTKISIIDEGATKEDVKEIILDAYNEWYPAPTYVLLLGDVEVIPAYYHLQHTGQQKPGLLRLDIFWGAGPINNKGYIASDLEYVNVDGDGYIPDMICGRISVDTEEQARIIVNKILNYTQTPPSELSFYSNILNAGQFEDQDFDAIEDEQVEFIYTLERIRHYLKDAYSVHVNYSSYLLHYDNNGTHSLEDLWFRQALDIPGVGSSRLVQASLADVENFEWLWSYVRDPAEPGIPSYYTDARESISNNINDGRFLFLYYGHGGSKNMKWLWELQNTVNNRDHVEGLYAPYYNTSYFSDLTNGNMLPLILCMSCDSGWYDGETDEDVLDFANPPNPFEDYRNECFAENITRLEGGGAIAAIASSRPAYGEITQYLLEGIMKAFWPGFLDSQNQPMYKMGTALVYGKLNAKRNYVQSCGIFSSPSCSNVVPATFEGFQLFGDPEVELWTDVPANFSLSYPISIGTSVAQRFAVTVKDYNSGEPVYHAKVCIQEDDKIFVGYTDTKGQVLFDLAPSTSTSHINVTVTKHNYRPNMDQIIVHESEAKISLSENAAMVGDPIEITFTGFPEDRSVALRIDNQPIDTTIPTDTPYILDSLPTGVNRYLTVWAAVIESHLPSGLWQPVSVEYIKRISSEEGPDPYIYSHFDPSTWEDPSAEVNWDNPDIRIYLDGIEVSSMTQNRVHTVEVTVYNRGYDSTIPTTVTLEYAPFGGGVSFDDIGIDTVTPTLETPATAHFTITPPIPHSACLRVSLEHDDELLQNEINNVGYENTGVIQLSSPGERSFMLGNPTETTEYVFIRVKQKDCKENIWNATILDYSSQALPGKDNETIRLYIDPFSDFDDTRIFTAEVYVNGVLKGGMIFNATMDIDLTQLICDEVCLMIIGFSIAVVVIVGYTQREKILPRIRRG